MVITNSTTCRMRAIFPSHCRRLIRYPAAMRTILTTLHSKFIHPSLALPYLAAFCGRGLRRAADPRIHRPRTKRERPRRAAGGEARRRRFFGLPLEPPRDPGTGRRPARSPRPDLRLVLGGPEVSFEGPELFVRHPGVTALVRGEGELPLRGLLGAWARNEAPQGDPPSALARRDGSPSGADGAAPGGPRRHPLALRAGLVDLSRGFVYYETSRGCPYTCAFCMSALDERVRSFSMERIRHRPGLADGRAKWPKIKLVDRTFNYDAARAREIFAFILETQPGKPFSFRDRRPPAGRSNPGASGEAFPPGMFQFEIGVQSTLPATLDAIGRTGLPGAPRSQRACACAGRATSTCIST